MKHIIEKNRSGLKSKITITERDYESNFTPIEIEISKEFLEPESDFPETTISSFTFYEKKDLSKFIGVLLHVQSKMK